MTFQVYIQTDAEADILEAAIWYESQAVGLANQFLDELSAVFNRMAETPQSYSEIYPPLRRALIKRFPFGIFYLVENKTLVVMAVMHASRSPEHWKRRV